MPGDAGTGEAGAAAARRHRHAEIAGDADDGGDVGGRARPHDDLGADRRRGQCLVVAVVLTDVVAGDDLVRVELFGEQGVEVGHDPRRYDGSPRRFSRPRS